MNVTGTLAKALAQLKKQRQALDGQIAAIEAALGGMGRTKATLSRPGRRRRPMSKAARAAVSKRMKAFWAKRRKATKAAA